MSDENFVGCQQEKTGDLVAFRFGVLDASIKALSEQMERQRTRLDDWHVKMEVLAKQMSQMAPPGTAPFCLGHTKRIEDMDAKITTVEERLTEALNAQKTIVDDLKAKMWMLMGAFGVIQIAITWGPTLLGFHSSMHPVAK